MRSHSHPIDTATMLRLGLVAVAILVCASWLSAQEQSSAQQGNTLTNTVLKDTSEKQAWTPPPGFYDDRIISPGNIPTKPAVRKPFRPFASIRNSIENGLDYVEEANTIDRLVLILHNPHIRPVFGSLGDGSGFGGGVALSSGEAISPRLEVFGLAHVTMKRYLQGQAGVRFKPSQSLGDKLAFSLTSELRLLPEEDFWGIGPTPGGIRTNYNLESRMLSADMTLRPTKALRAGVALVYDSASVFRGEDERYPATASVFPVLGTPGLLEGAALLSPSVFAEYDGRRGKNAPMSGFYAFASIASNDSVGRGDFSFWSYQLDTRFYTPLWSDARVLAARTVLRFNEAKGGSQIPFYRLARLGDTQTLRGYDSHRFHGNHAAAWNVEYRNDLTGGIGAFAFTDFGQVFNSRSEFNTRNFRVTYGGGLQFKTRESIVLRTYLAKSEEGTRFFFSFGPTF